MKTVNNSIRTMPMASPAEADLRAKLEVTVTQVSKLIELVNDDIHKKDVSTQLQVFVDEATKKEPSKWTLDISSQGLLDAAKAVASLTTPVTTAVKAVLGLLAL
jgi:hypothetical protein